MGVNENGKSDEFGTDLRTGEVRLGKEEKWVVVYRTGGTENFAWHQTVEFADRADAEACAEGVSRGGRENFLLATSALRYLGMPTRYEGYTL